MVAALEQCVGYTEGSFLNVGQSICLPPYFPSCKYVTAADPAADECKLYTVQQGDTMASIASSFNVYMHWMVDLNGESVQPGQRIKLPPWYSRCPSMESATNPPCRVYRVKEGDTIFRIASGFRISVDQLVAANPGFTVNSVLSKGQPVKIPPFDTSCGKGTVSEFPTDGVTSCRAYRVKSGDSVYSIALAFATSGDDIVALNPELNDPSRLAPGNAIKIPPWDDSCSEKGILVDPSSDNNTPSGTGDLVPGTGTSAPTPAASSSVPTTPVTANPPRQVDTGASASARAPVPARAPGPSTAANATVVTRLKSKLEMLISGVSHDEFALKQQSVVSAIATAAKVPTTSVSITFVVPAKSSTSGRRLLISSSAVKVQSIVKGDPVAVKDNLLAAERAGTLSASFTVEGMSLDTMTMIDPLGNATPIVTSASSDAAAADTTSDSESTLPLPLGMLIGISLGVIALILALVAICCCVSKRRKRRQEEENAASTASADALNRYAGVNAYVTTPSTRNKYGSDELKDYNDGRGNDINGNTKQQRGGRHPSFNSNSTPRRGPGSDRSTKRGSSRQHNVSDAYVISTTVSNIPNAEDNARTEVPSRPPSSATSVAEMLVDGYQPIHAPTVPVIAMTLPQQQYEQPPRQVIETTGTISPKESVAEASFSSYASDTVETYEQEQYSPAAPIGRPAPTSRVAKPVAAQMLDKPSARNKPFERNSFPRAARQPEDFSVAAVQSKSAFRNTDSSPPRREGSASLSPATKRGYVSPYSQKVISGQISLPRSPSRTVASGRAGRVAAKITTTTTVNAGVGAGSPVRAGSGYVSPYSQQKLRSPKRSPTKKTAHERLSAYSET